MGWFVGEQSNSLREEVATVGNVVNHRGLCVRLCAERVVEMLDDPDPAALCILLTVDAFTGPIGEL